MNYYSDMRNNIYIQCEEFLSKQEDEKGEISNQAREDQDKIAEKIKEHERSCLDQMPSNEFEEKLSKEIEKRIKSCEARLQMIGPWAEIEMYEEGYEIDLTMLMIQRRLFMNKSLAFMNKNELSEYWNDGFDPPMQPTIFKRGQVESRVKPFGGLYVVEDDLFMGQIFTYGVIY